MSVSLGEIKREWRRIQKPSKFKNWLRKHGLKQIGEGYHSIVYSHPSIDFVVKISRYGRKIEYPRSKQHLLFDRFVHPYYVSRSQTVMIQKKVNTKGKKKAQKILSEMYKKTNLDIEFYYDVHYNNVGWLGDNPVIIDCGKHNPNSRFTYSKIS